MHERPSILGTSKGQSSSRPVLVLLAGALIFIAGCITAVVRESLKDQETRLSVKSSDILDTVVSTYGSEGGPLSLTMFVSEPDLLLSRSELEGSTGRVTLTLEGPQTYRIHFPDRESFESSDPSPVRTSKKVVAVTMDDGRVVPGWLEVTTIG